MNENYGVHVVKFPANWTLRFVVAVLASAMLMSGAIVGMAPQAWRILNAHEEVPVELGGFGGLATRSQILGLNGQQVSTCVRWCEQRFLIFNSQVVGKVLPPLLSR